MRVSREGEGGGKREHKFPLDFPVPHGPGLSYLEKTHIQKARIAYPCCSLDKMFIKPDDVIDLYGSYSVLIRFPLVGILLSRFYGPVYTTAFSMKTHLKISVQCLKESRGLDNNNNLLLRYFHKKYMALPNYN